MDMTRFPVLWAARIWGGMVVLFVGFFVLAHLMGGDFAGGALKSPRDLVVFACFPVGTVLGLVLAYRLPAPGGALSVGCLLALFVLRRELLSNPLLVSMLGPGILYLVAAFLERQRPAA